MMMNYFKRLEADGLVDWCVLYIGFKGMPSHGRLPESEIKAYAYRYLETADASKIESELIIELMIADGAEEVCVVLQKLARHSHCDESISFRRWRYVALEELLKTVGQDPVYGLIELTEFWLNWGMNNSPHLIQGVDNDIPPLKYYTEENFKDILLIHIDWMKFELKEISIIPDQSV
jgi:hypothetical protein